MSNKVKFIHTADLHLGANPYKVYERYNDMFRAFETIVIDAIQEKIEYILISGDMFHTKDVDAETYNNTTKILDLAKNNSIKIICIEGNHDMKSYNKNISWLEQLAKDEKIILLKPHKGANGKRKLEIGKSIYQEDNLCIIGLGYPQSNAVNFINDIVEDLNEKEEILKGKNVICMLHAGIDRYVTEGMGGCRKDEIENLLSKIDYLALGHIHEKYEEDNKVFMPGSLENVSNISREGEKGYYISTIEDGKVTAKFKKLEIRKNHRYSIKISVDIKNIEEEVLNYVEREFAKLEAEETNESILQITVQGRNNITIIDDREVERILKERYNLVYIKIINNILSPEVSINEDQFLKMSIEEIEKKVKLDLFSEYGYEDNKEKVLDIFENIKDSSSSAITLNTDEGKELLQNTIDLLGLELKEIEVI